MGYRKYKAKPPEQNRSAVDIATPIKLVVQNGATASFAFPCWYQEVERPLRAHLHSKDKHDHCGWPTPDHHDHSCQLWIPEEGHCVHGMQECAPHCKHYIDYSKVTPIHLLSDYEGYEGAFVAWTGNHEGIEATAYIDPDEDWVVRVNVDVQDPNALDAKQEYKMTVFVGSDMEDGIYKRRDIVAPAKLVILPSAY